MSDLDRNIVKGTKVECRSCGNVIGEFNQLVFPHTSSDVSQMDFEPGNEYENGEAFVCKKCNNGSMKFTWPDGFELIMFGKAN